MRRKKYHLSKQKCTKLTQQIIMRFKLCMNDADTSLPPDTISHQKWIEILEEEKPKYSSKKMDIIWTIIDDITQSSAARGYVALSDVEALFSDICDDSVDTLHGCLY